jgi:hypothetical protein
MMRVHREDLGTVAHTVASNYRSHVCSPCALAYITTRNARVLCDE